MVIKSAFDTYKRYLNHYAWLILLMVVGLQTVGSGMRMAFGAFIDPLSETFGWSQGAIGFAYALQFIVSALIAPAAGWLSEVYGVRRTLFGAVITFTIGLALTGTITELWQFYLYYGVIMGTALSLFSVSLVTSISYWFKQHQGLAIGIVMASLSAGPAIAAPAVTLLISGMGWKQAMLVIAAVGGIFMMLMAAKFYSKPADLNMNPYGILESEPPAPRSNRAVDKARATAFFKSARSTVDFWNLVNIHFLGCIGHSIIIVYATAMAIHEGIDPVVAAGVVSIFMAISTITRFLTPVLSEAFSAKTIMAMSYFLQGVTVFILLGADSPLHFYSFAIIFAVGYGGEGAVFPILNRQYYRDAPIGTVYGWQMFGAGLGMALGGWIGGWLFDITGTYTWTILVSAATSLGGAVSILFLSSPWKHLIPDWEKNMILPTEAIAHVH